MKHFKAEEIARFAEGHVVKSEQEEFIAHLAACERCFKAYTDTVKFLEVENKNRFASKFPGLVKIKNALPGFWRDILIPFKTFKTGKPLLIPSLAILIILLLGGPYVFKTLRHSRIEKAQFQQIERDIENMEARGFGPSRSEVFAAVRLGIFLEDLSLLVHSGSNRELESQIIDRLSSELKPVAGSSNPLIDNLPDTNRANFKEILKAIRELMERRALDEFFRFGGFLEHAILSSYANESPKPGDIDKYGEIARKYSLQFPPGVLKEWEKLNASPTNKKTREIFCDVKEIFLSLE